MKNKGRMCVIAIALASATIVVAQDDDHTITDGIGRTYLRPNSFSPAAPSTFAVGTAPTSGYALDVHGELMHPQLGNVFKTDAPSGTDTYWRMFHGGNEYGNLFHLAGLIDFNINAIQGYLRFHTNTTDRMRLTPTLLGQVVNGFPGLDLSGHLGLGDIMTVPPLTYLHINKGAYVFTGYRPWMITGTYMSENSDGMYVGTKNGGFDRIDAVINWSDNKEALPAVGPDALRFIFTRAPDNTSTASTTDGLEIGRIIPAASGNEGYFGVGDFFTPGLEPTERLDVLNGRVRIRQLPDDPGADHPFKVMVVDDSPGPSAERGVAKWVDASSFASCSSGWSLQGNNAVTAFDGNPCPPQSIDRVGIGTSSPLAKLDVVKDGTAATFDVAVRTEVSTTASVKVGVDTYGWFEEPVDNLSVLDLDKVEC